MKSAIITGATGFVGVHLCENLSRKGVQVTALVRKESENLYRLPSEVNLIFCDMDSYSTVDIPKYDVFYHLAWEGATGDNRSNPSIQIKNALRTTEALHLAIGSGCGKFIGLGTVYEKLVPQVAAYTGFRKADYYLLSKNYAHEMCDKIAHQFNFPFVWATIFQPIGKYLQKEQVAAYIIKSLADNISPLLGEGLQPFDMTAVEDIVDGLRLLGECNVPERDYYIGSGESQTLQVYTKKIHDILKSNVALRFGERPDDGLLFLKEWYNIDALVKATGYSPTTPFDAAVANTFEWVNKFKY